MGQSESGLPLEKLTWRFQGPVRCNNGAVRIRQINFDETFWGALTGQLQGEYCLDGEDVSKKSDNDLADIRNKRIGFIFQSYNLLSRVDAASNVELPLIYRGMAAGERRARSIRALESVGLSKRSQHQA